MPETGVPEVVEAGDALVHAWGFDGPGAGLGRPAAPEIEERSQDWPVQELAREGWRLVETPLGEIKGDAPLAVLTRVGALLDDFEAMIRASIQGPAPRAMYRYRVFADKRDFCTFAACIGAANAQSLYDPETGEVALWAEEWFFGDEGAHFLPAWESVVAHETVHAYMDLVWNRTGPLWFAEGMAEYFASFRWRGKTPVPGAVNRDLVELARSERLSLPTLVRMPRDEMYGPEWQRYYALAWSAVHYLQERVPDLARRLLAGRGDIPEPEALDQDWWRYVEAL